MDRRRFLSRAGLLGGGLLAAGCGLRPPGRAAPAGLPHENPLPLDPSDWSSVREQFAIAARPIDLSALYVASHPAPVRAAIAEHRRGLDRAPTRYLLENDARLTRAARAAAADYMGGDRRSVALVDSTTMGLGLLYNGQRLAPGDDVLTTEHDYYVTHESLRQAAERSGATVRRIPLYERIEDVTADGIVERIVAAVLPQTRVVAVTWVHSGTGLKIPVARIAEALREVNEDREEAERTLLCVDGVHGFGVEAEEIDALGCDFFVSGTHKWVFGPRGTGVLWGREGAWPRVRPLVPSFLDDASWAAWSRGSEPSGPPDGGRMTPGGFKPFEHRWAMAQAFEFLATIGKERVRERTHALAGRLRRGLAKMDHVRLVTPMDPALAAGIVCCDVDGWPAAAAVRALGERGVVATVTPYAVEYLRLSPSIRNTPAEVDAALAAIRDLA